MQNVPAPTEEHRWLDRLIGDWLVDDPGDAGATGAEPWRESTRRLGDYWIISEASGEMPGGGKAETRLTLGHDPARGRFVGTWVGSMMPVLWVYEGTLDASGTVLTLDCEGPDMEDPTRTRRYQDVITITGPDERLFTARVADDDGGWREMMTMRYRRAG